MLEFQTVRWKNFLSTGNQFTEIQLNKSNTTLIVGKNGAGKSTLLDAITYALFGKPFRKINKPQLHNTVTRKNLLVELEIKINGISYLIRRGDRPGIFEVIQDGKLLNQDAKNTEYQDVLEKQIIKCNFKSFCQIVILGSATYQPFMALPAGNRREIIEDILDLQIFTTMNKLLVQKINDNNTKISDASNEKKLIASKIQLIKEHLAEIRESADKVIAEKKERYSATLKQIEDIVEKISTLKDKNEKLQSDISDRDTVSNKIKSFESLKIKIQHKISEINKEIVFFDEHDDCPTCRQSIDHEFKSSMISANKDKLEEKKNGLNLLKTDYNKLCDRLNEISSIMNEITSINLELHALNTRYKTLTEYNDQLLSDIKEIQVSNDEKDTSSLRDLESELKSIETKLVEFHDNKNLFQITGMLLKDGGIKSKIVKQYIPIINKLINKYLSTMDFFVNFELNESFEETIKSRFRDEFTYASFSEGEKMRINLAILFTWRAVAKLRNSINTNLLIMDEVLDGSMDNDTKDAFFHILETMGDTNVFVISHAGDSLFDRFDSVIKFEKHKNFSRMI